MSDYGLVEAERAGALEEARSIARRLRRVATEIEKLADEAEGSTDQEEKIGQLADRVTAAVLAGISALHLARLVSHSVGWAAARTARR